MIGFELFQILFELLKIPIFADTPPSPSKVVSRTGKPAPGAIGESAIFAPVDIGPAGLSINAVSPITAAIFAFQRPLPALSQIAYSSVPVSRRHFREELAGSIIAVIAHVGASPPAVSYASANPIQPKSQRATIHGSSSGCARLGFLLIFIKPMLGQLFSTTEGTS